MLYIELLKYTRAIRFYALKRQKQGLCITIHFTIAHSIAFLVAQSEIVNFSPKRSYLLIKGLKISIFEPFTGGGYLCPASRSGPGFPPYAGVFRHQVQISDHVPRFSDHHISLTRFSDQSFFLIYIRFSATPIFIFLNKFVNHMLTFGLNNVIIHLSRKG